MKNYSSEGIQLAIKTGNKYYSSDLVLEENIAGVAVINSVDEKTTTRFGGIFKISKDSSTFTLGQAVYFNTTTKLATDNPIGAVQIGFCIEDFESAADQLKDEGLEEKVEQLLEERQQARAERNVARSDEIRDELLKMNVVVEDTKDGQKWRMA